MSIAFRILGVVVGSGFGAAAGWGVYRLTTRPRLQSFIVTLAGWCIGSACAIGAAVAQCYWQSSTAGGLGSISAGLSEGVLIGLPIALLLITFAGGPWLRQRFGTAAWVPVLLGMAAALAGALSVATSINVT